jgi:hypothetical protein
MLSATYVFNTYEICSYSRTHVTKYEKIFLVGFDIFGKDRRIKTTLDEIDNIRKYLMTQTKSEQFKIYLDIDELISKSQIGHDKPIIPLTECFAVCKFKQDILKYLVLREILFKEELIRLLV